MKTFSWCLDAVKRKTEQKLIIFPCPHFPPYLFWRKIGTQSHSVKFLNWGDQVNSVPDLAASPPCWSLFRNVWFHISLFCCRRGFEGQWSLKRRSFTFDVDAKGDHFVSMTHDESTKNHPGGVSDVESFEKKCKNQGKNVQNQQQNRWLHWSRSFSLKIASWMRSAVPISQTKLAANWQDMIRKSAARSKQAVSNDEGDQLRGQPFPCLHQ